MKSVCVTYNYILIVFVMRGRQDTIFISWCGGVRIPYSYHDAGASGYHIPYHDAGASGYHIHIMMRGRQDTIFISWCEGVRIPYSYRDAGASGYHIHIVMRGRQDTIFISWCGGVRIPYSYKLNQTKKQWHNNVLHGVIGYWHCFQTDRAWNENELPRFTTRQFFSIHRTI